MLYDVWALPLAPSPRLGCRYQPQTCTEPPSMVSLHATAQNLWPGCAHRLICSGPEHSLESLSSPFLFPLGRRPNSVAMSHLPKQVCAPLLFICPFRPPAHLQPKRSGTRNAALTLPIAVLMPPGPSKYRWLPDTLFTCDVYNEEQNCTVTCVPGSGFPVAGGGCAHTHTHSLVIMILVMLFL